MCLRALPKGLLVLRFGGDHIFTKMKRFFTEAALLTFGGDYAVVPYFHQGVVNQLGRAVATQMIDGLALGENTLGPLIAVVAFVCFIEGCRRRYFEPRHIFWLSRAVAAGFLRRI